MTGPLSLPVIERRGFDNSVLSTHGRCPRLDYYNYRIGRASRRENFPINFGGAYHKFRDSIEKLYAQWVEAEDKEFDKLLQTLIFNSAFAVATLNWSDPPLEHKKSYLDLGRFRATCEEAFEGWVNEKTQGFFKVIGTETGFELELPLRLCHQCFQWYDSDVCPTCDTQTHVEYFTGRIDQIIEWNRRLWVRDWKTTGRKEDFNKKYNPDHQFTGYVWAASVLSQRQISGVIVDLVYNIKTKGPEFYPTFANRNSEDIAQWKEWMYFEYADRRRAESTGIWPMRTSACGDYGGCFFRECCNRASWPSIQQWLEENTIYSEWDPMEPEKEEGLPE